MRRNILLLTAVAMMAVMMVVSAAPVMAQEYFPYSFDFSNWSSEPETGGGSTGSEGSCAPAASGTGPVEPIQYTPDDGSFDITPEQATVCDQTIEPEPSWVVK